MLGVLCIIGRPVQLIREFFGDCIRRYTTSSPPFFALGDFHARSTFARSTIPEEKLGSPRSLIRRRRHTFASL